VQRLVGSFFILLFLTASVRAQDAQATLAYLDQTIDWYQHMTVQEQLATDSSEVVFVDDGRQLSRQIGRLSFDFARANAQRLSKRSSAAPEQTEGGRYSALFRAASRVDEELRSTKAEMDSSRQKLQNATGANRREIQATIDELQSEVNLIQTRSQTLHNILQYVNESGAGRGSLTGQVDELQRSIPELAADAAKSPAVDGRPVNRRESPSGILSLITDLVSLNLKIGSLDQNIGRTTRLAESLQKLKAPLNAELNTSVRRGEELAKQADLSNSAELSKLKQDLDSVTETFGKYPILSFRWNGNRSYWISRGTI